MKYSIIKISKLIGEVLSKEIHLSPIKTLCLLVYGVLQSRSTSVGEWASKLAVIKSQVYHNCKYVIWRFLKTSVFDVYEVYKAITQWVVTKIPDEILVCIDWTDVYVFKVIALSVALPSLGRTMPLYMKVIRKDMTENEMTDMEKEILSRFFEGLDEETRRRVIIIGDRGFAKVELFRHIEGYQARYIIRLPRTAYVEIDGGWIPLTELPIESYEGKWYKGVLYSKEHRYKINLACRDVKPEKVNNKDDDSWLCATNGEFGVNGTCGRYSKRMKIDEMFRDFKSGAFNCEDTLCKDEQTADKIMLVLTLAYVFLVWWCSTEVPTEVTNLVTTQHKKKGIKEHSLFQIALRTFSAITLIEGWTKELIDFVQTYLLIRSNHRKKIELTALVHPNNVSVFL